MLTAATGTIWLRDNYVIGPARANAGAMAQGELTSMSSEHPSVPYGYCHCGCGEKAQLASVTNRKAGRIAGQPCRFVHGHNGRRRDWDDSRDCPHCGEHRQPEEFYPGRPECKSCTGQSQKRARAEGRVKRTERDPEQARALSRASYRRHRARRMAEVRRWQQANPGRVREIKRLAAARRLARKLGQFVEEIDLSALILRDEGRCGICAADIDGPDFHIDHIFPLSKGGEHSMANVQLAHPTCNVRKGASLGTRVY